MTTDLDRLRTDAIISIHQGSDFDFESYISQLPGENISKEDMATMLGAMQPQMPEYSMIDLNAPMAVSQMKIPNHKDFLAGHTKVSNSPLTDWPTASPDNQFGKHHPFGMESNSCPLLHGASWGEPAYAEHLAHAMPMLKSIAEHERRLTFDPEIFGDAKESMHDLMTRDRNRYRNHSDEEYTAGKIAEWQKRLGMIPYLFGLEYNTEDQRQAFLDILQQMATKKSMTSPDSKYLQNKMQEKAGISWGRALRSFRARFMPMLQWWRRASDRHGPTAPPKQADFGEELVKSEGNALMHFVSPYVEMPPMGVEESHTAHWWDLFQPWGGVGRDYKSLHDILKQSYPKMFDGGWLDEMLMNQSNNMLNVYSTDGGSHFPHITNHPEAKMHPDHSSYKSTLNGEDFERRRSNWSHASNLHFLHPSEVKGQGGRMIIPSNQMMLSRLGRSLANQADMGSPRIGLGRENHPSSNNTYWDSHNALFAANDKHLGTVMKNMAQRVMKQFGSGILNPTDPNNMEQATLARGNLQQLASAADFAMKKVNMGEEYRALAPVHENGNISLQIKSIGPVNPTSFATTPPIYNTGNTHLWGHEMPSNLTWKFDPQSGGINFGMADEPFNVMQRTVHENKIKAVLPSLLGSNVQPKQQDIYALSAVDQRGLSPITTGSILKAEEYKPTGVFQTQIIPAYTIHKLDDMDKLRGFSGDWIVQRMPKGDRMFVEKSGNHLKNAKVPKDVKKQLREIQGDFVFDAYLDGDKLHVVDLLVHKGTDLALEPLEDRINALRTLYDSTENVHFPMPTNCVSTDQEGLNKAIYNFDEDEVLIRDSKSTFMKEKEVHPKWIRYAKDSIAKSFYPPMPELIVYPDQVKLCYPSIIDPVIVKGDFDGKAFTIKEVEGNEALFSKAEKDIPLWGPLAVSLLKEGGAASTGGGGSSGAFTSSNTGGFNPIHSKPKRKRPRKLKIIQKTLLRAPAIIGEDEKGEGVSHIMKHARRAITDDDTAKTTEYLVENVKGLTKKMLEMYSGEYGLEKTENGKWTVNEAIDDDIIERMFPRMNRISPDGGAWAGMQADITAPRGPTELIEDSGTTFYDPKEGEEVEEIPMKHLQVKDNATGEQATVDIQNGKATLRMPLKTQQEMADEQEVDPDDRSEAEEI